jgi:hypothetical protein
MRHILAHRGLVLLGTEEPPDLLYVSYPQGSTSADSQVGEVREPDHRIALYARLDALSQDTRAQVLKELEDAPEPGP